MNRSRVLAVLCALVGLLGLPTSARANVTQPDGTVIPAGAGSGVRSYFAANGDSAINPVSEAATMPETFVPQCHLAFTLIVHDAANDDEFGWYNVVAGRAPNAGELIRMLMGSQSPGTTATIDLSQWRGGDIGFYMRNNTQGRVYYSQRSYNPDSSASHGYIHMLTWNSHAMPTAYYFGWEDLYGAAGNDNDFNDMLVQVGGITCTGGGAACTVPGATGTCAHGIQQCRGGALMCLPTTVSSPERCDGLDNDCNGMTDDGSNLCAAGQVCQRGVCVARCVESSCFEGQTCGTDGICTETACAAVTCPAGQRCMGGACHAPCDGVTCPHGQSCNNGLCVDPCAGVTCDSDAVCIDGVCQPNCMCRPCGASLTCLTTGQCVAPACAALNCGVGDYCADGGCHASCGNATCPTGQSCVAGNCVEGSGMQDAGMIVFTDGQRHADAADGGHAGGTASGCACAVAPGARGDARGALTVSLGAVAMLRVRRSRQRRRGRPGATARM